MTTTPETLGDHAGELLILPDGRVLVHNLTPELAALLSTLDPCDEQMRLRAASANPSP